MSPLVTEVCELFDALESPKQLEAQEMRTKILEMLSTCKDSWIILGLIDYQLATGSIRAADIISKAPQPHDKVFLDRTAELLKSQNRVPALALLAHIVRKQPSWLHKLPQHSIFRDLLLLVRNERDPVPLLSGLLLLITLLPMIPTMISPFFQEIFDVFGRLAAWDGRTAPYPHRDHLQLALYGLFQNLYGMFPCHFIDYLRREYCKRENSEVFTHTVKPMLESVHMHPQLVISSKSIEAENTRWKKMEHHDVLVECRRFSSEGHRQRFEDDGRFRSRCGTDVASLVAATTAAVQFQTSKSSNSTPNLIEAQTTASMVSPDPPSVAPISIRYEDVNPGGENWFSLSEACGTSSALSAPHTPLPLPIGANFQDSTGSQASTSQIAVGVEQQQQDSGSPPEAAIEATPENTPIKDTRQRFTFQGSSVTRALSTRLVQPLPSQQYQLASSSSYSQPPSPLKKELSTFNRMYSMESGEEQRKETFYAQHRLTRVLQDRTQHPPEPFSGRIPSPQKQSGSPLKKIILKDSSGASMPSVPNSPVPLGAAAPVSGSTDWLLAKPKPHKDGVPFDAKEGFNFAPAENVNKEDKEIIELSKRGELMRSSSINRDAVSVAGDAEGKLNRTTSRQHQEAESHEEVDWGEEEPCQGADKQCIEKNHGLHMPYSTSMLEIARRVTDRSRFYSQCIHEPSTSDIVQTHLDTELSSIVCCHMRRKRVYIKKSSSCPEIHISSFDKSSDSSSKNMENGNVESIVCNKMLKNEETQTVEVWPLGFEHLFTDILQSVYDQNNAADKPYIENKVVCRHSEYYAIDRYIEVALNSKSEGHDKKPDEMKTLQQKLELIQLELAYEKHRREVHAVRNRRLLGRSRKNRATEEQNIALRQQMTLLQTEIDDLRLQVTKQKQNLQLVEQKNQENVKYWQHQLHLRECDLSTAKTENERLASLLLEEQNSTNETSVDVQHLHAALFDVSQQLQRAMRKSEMGDRQLDYIKQLQRELIICGEWDSKYKDVLGVLQSKNDLLVNKLTQQYKEQVNSIQSALQTQTTKMDYWQSREAELDNTIERKELMIQELKKQLRLVKEEYSEKLKAIDEKYMSVKRVNQRMEAHCLEILQKVPQSPQTLSRDLTSGFSPQSSPLSASLASSEGHGPLIASRVEEIRNLQVIVDAHDTIEESTSNSVNNNVFEDDTQ